MSDKTIEERVTAAKERLQSRPYLTWDQSGGHNECAHGYCEGIPCPKCDRELVESAKLPTPEPQMSDKTWMSAYCNCDKLPDEHELCECSSMCTPEPQEAAPQAQEEESSYPYR